MPAPTQDNQTVAAMTTTLPGQEAAAEEQKKEEEQKKQSLTPEKKVKVAKRIVKASLFISRCVFMPLPNVVWPEAYCFCPVCQCVRPETLLTQNLAEYGICHILTKHTSAMHYGDRNERVTVWGGQKVEGHRGIKYAGKQHFLGWITRCLEKC